MRTDVSREKDDKNVKMGLFTNKKMRSIGKSP